VRQVRLIFPVHYSFYYANGKNQTKMLCLGLLISVRVRMIPENILLSAVQKPWTERGKQEHQAT